jgi:hypothetical protein
VYQAGLKPRGSAVFDTALRRVKECLENVFEQEAKMPEFKQEGRPP